MNFHVENYLKNHNIHIEYSSRVDFDAKMFDIPKGPVIIVNSTLSEGKQELAILHELGHDIYDKDTCGSYKSNDKVHTKMEVDANKFMLRETLNVYSSENNVDPQDINSIKFLESHDLNLNLNDLTRSLINKMIDDEYNNRKAN